MVTSGASPDVEREPKLNRWWLADKREQYWLESTDREDLGANLHAPQADGSGRENWRYTLCNEMLPGDIVFHYFKPDSAIVAWSRVRATARPKEIVWGARGTVARAKGVVPHLRPGLLVEIEGFERLSQPLSIDEIRGKAGEVRTIVDELSRQHGSLYFPFEIGYKRPLRTLQGYVFKVPRRFVELFSALRIVADGDAQYVEPSSLREAVNSIRESRRIGRVVSVPRLNEAPERVIVTATAFKRLAGIVEAALFRASGLCEACGSAPFADERGNTFLEVHHIRTLAEGGPDCLENVVALCPNCHRALHYAADKDVRKDLLFERVPGIVRY